MFPYGVGDTQLSDSDDGTSGQINLSETVYFFKEPVSHLQVIIIYLYNCI